MFVYTVYTEFPSDDADWRKLAVLHFLQSTFSRWHSCNLPFWTVSAEGIGMSCQEFDRTSYTVGHTYAHQRICESSLRCARVRQRQGVCVCVCVGVWVRSALSSVYSLGAGQLLRFAQKTGAALTPRQLGNPCLCDQFRETRYLLRLAFLSGKAFSTLAGFPPGSCKCYVSLSCSRDSVRLVLRVWFHQDLFENRL